ncbi:MAG: hypothetical protein M3082_15340 [Candidatus Dormibacteraeota bacterium]|nr:hypothetical protein [Candidatus Dormibacteraeota bacterium]
MASRQSEPAQPPPQTRFSADGFWWWDGAEWKPAFSQDRLWRWTGTDWLPAGPATPPPGGGLTIRLVAGLLGILVIVALFVLFILYELGPQIQNVFSNVTTGLG